MPNPIFSTGALWSGASVDKITRGLKIVGGFPLPIAF